MPLRIIKATEPMLVERLNVCIYGAPGLGKTSLGFTAPTPLLLDFDGGAYRAGNRKDTLSIARWQEVAAIKPADLDAYKTIVVDTAGRALDLLTQDIIALDAKMGRAGALTLQGFGQLKSRFIAWLKMLNTLGKDIVLVAHMDEQRNGDDTIERLDIQGSSKGEIYKTSDAMGRIILVNNARFIDFSPRNNAFGKNPANLELIPFPPPAECDNTLANIFLTIKTALNKLSREQLDAQQLIDEWQTFLRGLKDKDVETLNGNLGELRKAPLTVRSFAQKRAKELGFTWNKSAQLYEVANAG